MINKIKEYQELIKKETGSKTFCILPWIHMATRPNGDARLCCVTNASGAHTGDHTVGLVKTASRQPANFGKENPLEAWNNEYMRDVRKLMLDEKIPASCTKCFEEETNGVVSKRMWELHEWKNKEHLDIKKIISETDNTGRVPDVIRYLDLRLGHTCNLKCVMCSPHDSSRWVQDHQKIFDNTTDETVKSQISWDKNTFNNYWYERPELWEEIFKQIPNIRQLYFAGGEPLMIKEHKKLLLEIIKRGYNSQIGIRYNSNGILVDDEMIDIWSKFKQVRYAFSIDAYNERNYYIRFPTNWDSIERSLRILDNTPDNISISIACAVQALNVKHITEFAKWKEQQKFKKINKSIVDGIQSGGGLINLHLLYIPTFLSARILPKEDKKEIKENFLEFKDWLWNNYTQDDDFWKNNPYAWGRWEAILRFIDAEDHTHLLPGFKEYIKNLDRIRHTDAKVIFPELAHLF